MRLLPLIVSIAAITFTCRALPLMLLASRSLSLRVLAYLRMLPLGVLAAVAAVSIWPHGRSLDVASAMGIGVAAVLAMRTGNLLITLLGAMATAAVLRVL